MKKVLLGVNIDHIATVRQARGSQYPDPVQAALAAELAGADGITLHLREDRRHIQERDVAILSEVLQTRMNLEMAVTEEMCLLAKKYKPQHCCFVPEKRQELTTEGGLDVAKQVDLIHKVTNDLQEQGTEVSLFIDPEIKQIDAAVDCKAQAIELHTGCYAEAKDPKSQAKELVRLVEAAKYASQAGLIVNAGHGLHYHNTFAIAQINEINELNIGHAIIAHALFVGLTQAVKEMRDILDKARMA